ncbi:Deferrochelatase OS=Streptomyces griseomycini OX=66895 GN=FHS37_001898 PE=3 SV=1 [Streptomyces griseomycini]
MVNTDAPATDLTDRTLVARLIFGNMAAQTLRAAVRLRVAELIGDGRRRAADVAAGPSSLTLTFGFGHSFFARTGLEKQRPVALDPLPDFSSDRLDKARSNGDLWVQISADDALVAFHALRAVQKDAGSAARVRWQMNGFNRSPGATAHPMTARNLMGQVDGTRNPKPADSDFDRRIFVPEEGEPAWMANGSYVVKPAVSACCWTTEAPLKEQENVIGRRKSAERRCPGAPDATRRWTWRRRTPRETWSSPSTPTPGSPADQNGGTAMLRRPFSYHDGIDQDGVPDAGLLLFICWQADPLRGFVPVQRKLDQGDALTHAVRHEASGLFAVPGGAAEGEYVGQRLLEG